MNFNLSGLSFIARLVFALLVLVLVSVVLLRSEYVLTSGHMLIADEPDTTELGTAQTLSAKEK
jgi:hypothetical protein